MTSYSKKMNKNILSRAPQLDERHYIGGAALLGLMALAIPIATGRTVQEAPDPAVAMRAESFSIGYDARVTQQEHCLQLRKIQSEQGLAPAHQQVCADASNGAP